MCNATDFDKRLWSVDNYVQFHVSTYYGTKVAAGGILTWNSWIPMDEYQYKLVCP